ncbi:MAG: GNAT family N-acetyltransferase [Methanomassiliicoccaceae archaeon]|nr:GNAT family N-acetyltransferase [Methanomassiliicoccaceae archaeon]
MKGNLKLRKIESGDDLDQIVNLIYDTDKYLYPDLFGDGDSSRFVLKTLLNKEGSRFYHDHYHVATMERNGKEEIVGLAALQRKEENDDHKIIADTFKKNGLKVPDQYENVISYFKKQSASTEYALCNVTVDENYRGQGIGASIVEKIIEISKKTGEPRIELVVLKENIAAIKLYEKFGFKQIGAEQKDYRGNLELKMRLEFE